MRSIARLLFSGWGLDEYAEHGIAAVDDIGDLQMSPSVAFGTPLEIVE